MIVSLYETTPIGKARAAATRKTFGYVFYRAPKALAHSSAAWDNAPGIYATKRGTGAESAIHFGH
ncbi:MAG: hypothetical protein DMF24_04740 [Verrucomicrobia bacterium]|nr:MAG: hypothetical protein DME90_06475 [Verrucomicrobiota bacterium]PYL62260.1 MAG: hypothetical protein DMF24_04740 [Verrucomicrobiota bacterium]